MKKQLPPFAIRLISTLILILISSLNNKSHAQLRSTFNRVSSGSGHKVSKATTTKVKTSKSTASTSYKVSQKGSASSTTVPSAQKTTTPKQNPSQKTKPAITPSPKAKAKKSPSKDNLTERSSSGKYTVPRLPEKTVVKRNGVTISHNYKSGDHGPAHLHVEGQGNKTKIGANGKPIKGYPALSVQQKRVVERNKVEIRKATNKLGKYMEYTEELRKQ